ncbi:SemiSWEET family sugar transporter [Bradyrhizobium sp.]|uniref:SemiSWEET family sugar transporter n=1 Tax=Bradyrhizobium sp. TaxID=376 RepID=UPI0039E42ABD
MDSATLIGGFAAVCTTISYFPQLKKCWNTGETGDLSIGMLLLLILGLATWVVYGFMREDMVVIAANSISVCLLLGILGFKLRELFGPNRRPKRA